jgi:hypothetical protein
MATEAPQLGAWRNLIGLNDERANDGARPNASEFPIAAYKSSFL